MARKPIRRKVLSFSLTVLIAGAGHVCYGACEAEAAAVALAEADLADAEELLLQAELDFMLDPNPTTAAVLALAQVDRDDAQTVYDEAVDDLSDCIANNPPPSRPIPIPLVDLAAQTSTNDYDAADHSVYSVLAGR